MNRVVSKFRCLTTSNLTFSAVRYSSQLFVSRLSFYSSNDQLKAIFSPFGDVKEARLVMDPRTGRTKGFGFVTFESEAESQKAIKALNGRIIQGRLIFVELANNTPVEIDASKR